MNTSSSSYSWYHFVLAQWHIHHPHVHFGTGFLPDALPEATFSIYAGLGMDTKATLTYVSQYISNLLHYFTFIPMGISEYPVDLIHVCGL